MFVLIHSIYFSSKIQGAGGGAEKKCEEEKDESDDDEDEEKLQKARAWDDWKDSKWSFFFSFFFRCNCFIILRNRINSQPRLNVR